MAARRQGRNESTGGFFVPRSVSVFCWEKRPNIVVFLSRL
jgi:hypothetical protein